MEKICLLSLSKIDKNSSSYPPTLLHNGAKIAHTMLVT